jgi:uncharacterized protein
MPGIPPTSVDQLVARYGRNSSPIVRKLYVGLGCLLLVFAVIGIWVPGWPTVSWAVPAAYLFSLSSERLFRWTLTNRWFGERLLDYYASDKTLPLHAKRGIMAFISAMSIVSAYATYQLGDPGIGSAFILAVGAIGVAYVGLWIPDRPS